MRQTRAYLFPSALLVLGLLLLPASSSAEPCADLSGRVLDQTGLPLPGVAVDVRRNGTRVDEALSGADGRYRTVCLAPGPATLSFRLINFASTSRTVSVAVAGTTLPPVVLPLAINADVTVTGPRTFRNLAELGSSRDGLIGVASAASEGFVTAAQLADRPLLRTGEMLETVPGLVVSQHSGEGKANQYYLRGFNLDHGTDLSLQVAGTPVNLPTHAHGHGYADLGFLIPELVSGIQFRKGSYSAEDGDFSAAGAAAISYTNTVERAFVNMDAGQGRWRRMVAAASPALAGGHLLGAVEVTRNDGPWVRPDSYARVNGLLRFSREARGNSLAITAMTYRGRWNATDQIPARAVTSGALSRFGAVDTTGGGQSHRHGLVVDAQRAGARRDLRMTAFALRYGMDLFSNFTYFLDNPVDGDQFEQQDQRWVMGGRVVERRLHTWQGRAVETAFGAELRRDAIGAVGLYRTRARQRLSTVREDAVGQTSGAGHVQSEVSWAPRLRTVLGLRADLYRFGVTSNTARNSGTAGAGLVSPKAALIAGPWRGTEVYLNAATGFHSNDARGATMQVDPESGEPAERVSPLVRARSAEVGVRANGLSRVHMAVSLWTLGLDSELLFVGDAGTTEASRPSVRHGIEWSTYARLAPGLLVDADLAWSRASFSDDQVANRIPGSVGRVVSAGLSASGRGLTASLRVRHFGPRPLTEDGVVRSASTLMVNAEAGYQVSRRSRLVLEAFNLFGSRANDIDYFYASRLPGEPEAGVDDRHSHPVVPRTFRLSLRLGL